MLQNLNTQEMNFNRAIFNNGAMNIGGSQMVKMPSFPGMGGALGGGMPPPPHGPGPRGPMHRRRAPGPPRRYPRSVGKPHPTYRKPVASPAPAKAPQAPKAPTSAMPDWSKMFGNFKMPSFGAPAAGGKAPAAPAGFKMPAMPKEWKGMMKNWGIGLMNLSSADHSPYLKVSKVVYDDAVQRINAYYKDQKDWIEKYAFDSTSEMVALEEWKSDALFMINHSEVGPDARSSVTAYLNDVDAVHKKWADLAKEHDEAVQKEIEAIEKDHVSGHCWSKVDFLEAIYVNTYLFSEDTDYGHFMFTNSKKHLDQQVKACKKFDAAKN